MLFLFSILRHEKFNKNHVVTTKTFCVQIVNNSSSVILAHKFFSVAFIGLKFIPCEVMT